MPVYYRNKKTGRLEAKFVGCDTNSVLFRNEELYERFESKEALPLEVKPVPIVPVKVPAERMMKLPDYEKEFKELEKKVEELTKRKPVVKEVVKLVPPPEKPKKWWQFWRK